MLLQLLHGELKPAPVDMGMSLRLLKLGGGSIDD
jgi:hypothetical protein